MPWVGVEFNAPHNKIKVILEVVFTVNLLTDTDKQTVQENTDTQTTLVQSPLTTLGQEMRWTYSTTLLSTHDAQDNNVNDCRAYKLTYWISVKAKQLCQKLTAGWFTLHAAEDVDGTGIETGVDSSVADISVPLLLLLTIHSMSKTRSPMRNPRSFKCPSFNITNVAIVIPSSETISSQALITFLLLISQVASLAWAFCCKQSNLNFVSMWS